MWTICGLKTMCFPKFVSKQGIRPRMRSKLSLLFLELDVDLVSVIGIFCSGFVMICNDEEKGGVSTCFMLYQRHI